ncbi:MAG TPA: hypothetical protein ENO00_03025 [Deltaproteobacteria bacterium]|nr:hypothetical protein [Deltaproteobacteria bacterium]
MTAKKEGKKERGMTMSIWINQETLDELDNVAKWADLNRSKLIQNFIEVAIDEMNLFRSLGIIRLTLISLDLRKQWKKAIEETTDSDQVPQKKRITDRGINVSIWIPRNVVEDIEDLAGKLNMSRSQVIEKLVDMGMAEMRILRNTGFAHVSKALRDIHEAISKRWKKSFKETEKAMAKRTLNLNGTNNNL